MRFIDQDTYERRGTRFMAAAASIRNRNVKKSEEMTGAARCALVAKQMYDGACAHVMSSRSRSWNQRLVERYGGDVLYAMAER
ncbi:MAG: hypothetical protein ACLTLQ_22250 [[Clostridium] scindens]